MPAVLDKDKPKASKPEAFVEKQIEHARGRIRALDFFQTGLILLIATLAFVFAILLIDRSYETPRGAGWASIFGWLLAMAGYIWYAHFRPSRRHINPFYAAHQVEQTIPDAKNSVVNYVDLQDDASVPASVKASIGARAAKDMKQVDMNRAIQKKQIIYLAAVAVAFFVATLIAAFLPATRTTMVVLSPKEGNTTVVQGEDVVFKVELSGRIPEKGQPDAARVRIWYNADDPGNYEERPLEPVEGERNVFGHSVPAKQVRNGFFYQIFAGNVKTPAYEVKLRIIPQFTGTWEVEYVYPDYLQRQPDKKADPNLVGYFNTQVTVTAHANRPVQSAVLEIDGHPQSFANIPVDNDPEAIRFQFPMTKNGKYRIRFVTTEGHKNPDPQWFRISLVDPIPAIRYFDVTFDYPKYLRYDKTTVILREPNLLVNRGTEVSFVAHANRPIKKALIQKDGVDIQATPVEGQPMQVAFKLPKLMEDGAYRVAITPDTDEKSIEPRTYTVRIISDESPKVEITKPLQEITELPVNGTLGIEGEATDDHGLTKLNLHMKVIRPAPDTPLNPIQYRGGISFLRKDDNSYPNHVQYKEVIELAKLKADGVPGFSVQPGMEIEYWLEAIDNCDVPPRPLKKDEKYSGNSGFSRHLLIRVMQPEMNPDKKKQLDKEKQQLDQDKRQHEQKQDQRNANEKRDPNQPKQPSDQQPGGMDEQKGEPNPNGKPKEGKGGMGGNMQPKMGDEGMADAEFNKQKKDLEEALGKNPMGGMKDPKDPAKDEPKPPEPKKEEKPDPRQLPKPEDVQKLAEKLDSRDKKEQQEAREQVKKNIEQAKNDPRKPEEAQKQIDDHRMKLEQGERKQFDESLERVAKEMKDIQREKRVNDAIGKITSGDKQQQQQGQQELENELRDPGSREDTERQLQNLAGDMGTERKKQIGDAMNLAKENLAKKPPKTSPEEIPMMPKEEEEKDVDKLAKKHKEGSEKEKKEAEQQLEKMLRDPSTRDKVQQQLEDYKNSIKDKQEREDFEKSMKQIAENAATGKSPEQRRAEEIQKLAEQLKSDDKKERDAAQKALEEAMKQTDKDKDPKAEAEAQKQLKAARDSIKDENKQKQFDQAVKEINEAVDKHRKEQAAAQQKTKDELDNIAKGLNDKDPAKQREAENKLAEMLKDPKTREQVKDQIDELKKTTPDAAARENIDKATGKAMDDMARKESLEKIAQGLNSKDPDKQKGAQEKLEEKLADPTTGEQTKKDLETLKQGMKDQDAKDNIDKAVGQAEQNIEKNKKETGKLANDLNSKDKATQEAAQRRLEEMLKDPAKREQVQRELDNIRKNAGDEKTKENIDTALQKAREDLARKQEMEKIATDLNSKNKGTQDAARRKLEQKLADPKTRDQVKNDLERLKEAMTDQKGKENIEDAVDQAEKNIAQNKKDAAKIAQDLTGKDKGKQDDAVQQLEDLLKEPAKRDQIKRELENIKKGLGDDQAKAKIDEAIQNAERNLAKKDGKGGEPKKADLDQIAKDLNSKEADKEKAAQQQLRDALKDPKTRAKVEKDFNDIKDKRTDPNEQKRLADALNKAKDDIAKLEKPLDPKEIEQLVKDLKGKDPKAAEDAKKKLDEMLDDPDMREKLAKVIDELMKNVKGDTAKKELDDQLKEVKDKLTKLQDGVTKSGAVRIPDGKTNADNTKEPAKEGSVADLKNKVRAGELLLEEFKRNVTNEEFRKRLGWTEKQLAEFHEKYEQQLAKLKEHLEAAEKGVLPKPREKGRSPLDDAGRVTIDPRDGSNPLQGGKYIAPPGFGDPYKRFTEEVSGVRPALPPATQPKK